MTAERTRRSRLLAGVLPGLVILGCTLPATIHNKLVSGDWAWVTSGGGEVLSMAWDPDSNGYYFPPLFVRPTPVFEHEDFRLEASRRLGHSVTYQESSAFWSREAFRQMIHSPSRTARLAAQKLIIALNDFEVPDSEFFEIARTQISLFQILPTFGWICGWGLIGFFLPGCFQRSRLIVLSMIGIHLLSIILTYNFARFRLGMIPFWILFAAFAVVVIVQNLASHQTRRQLLAMGGLLGGSLLCLSCFLPPPGYQSTGYPEFSKAFGAFLNERKQLLHEAEQLSHRKTFTLAEKQHLAELYFAAQSKDQAEEELESIIREDPNATTALMLLAVLHGERGHFSKAEVLLKRALAVQPDDVALWANLGNIDFHRALSGTISPAQRESWLRHARKAYARGLEIAPGDPVCLAGLSGVEQSLQMP